MASPVINWNDFENEAILVQELLSHPRDISDHQLESEMEESNNSSSREYEKTWQGNSPLLITKMAMPQNLLILSPETNLDNRSRCKSLTVTLVKKASEKSGLKRQCDIETPLKDCTNITCDLAIRPDDTVTPKMSKSLEESHSVLCPSSAEFRKFLNDIMTMSPVMNDDDTDSSDVSVTDQCQLQVAKKPLTNMPATKTHVRRGTYDLDLPSCDLSSLCEYKSQAITEENRLSTHILDSSVLTQSNDTLIKTCVNVAKPTDQNSIVLSNAFHRLGVSENGQVDDCNQAKHRQKDSIEVQSKHTQADNSFLELSVYSAQDQITGAQNGENAACSDITENQTDHNSAQDAITEVQKSINTALDVTENLKDHKATCDNIIENPKSDNAASDGITKNQKCDNEAHGDIADIQHKCGNEAHNSSMMQKQSTEIEKCNTKVQKCSTEMQDCLTEVQEEPLAVGESNLNTCKPSRKTSRKSNLKKPLSRFSSANSVNAFVKPHIPETDTVSDLDGRSACDTAEELLATGGTPLKSNEVVIIEQLVDIQKTKVWPLVDTSENVVEFEHAEQNELNIVTPSVSGSDVDCVEKNLTLDHELPLEVAASVPELPLEMSACVSECPGKMAEKTDICPSTIVMKKAPISKLPLMKPEQLQSKLRRPSSKLPSSQAQNATSLQNSGNKKSHAIVPLKPVLAKHLTGVSNTGQGTTHQTSRLLPKLSLRPPSKCSDQSKAPSKDPVGQSNQNIRSCKEEVVTCLQPQKSQLVLKLDETKPASSKLSRRSSMMKSIPAALTEKVKGPGKTTQQVDGSSAVTRKTSPVKTFCPSNGSRTITKDNQSDMSRTVTKKIQPAGSSAVVKKTSPANAFCPPDGSKTITKDSQPDMSRTVTKEVQPSGSSTVTKKTSPAKIFCPPDGSRTITKDARPDMSRTVTKEVQPAGSSTVTKKTSPAKIFCPPDGSRTITKDARPDMSRTVTKEVQPAGSSAVTKSSDVLPSKTPRSRQSTPIAGEKFIAPRRLSNIFNVNKTLSQSFSDKSSFSVNSLFQKSLLDTACFGALERVEETSAFKPKHALVQNTPDVRPRRLSIWSPLPRNRLAGNNLAYQCTKRKQECQDG